MNDPTALQVAAYLIVALLAGPQAVTGVRWFIDRRNGRSNGSVEDRIADKIEERRTSAEDRRLMRELLEEVRRDREEARSDRELMRRLIEVVEELVHRVAEQRCVREQVEQVDV